MIYWIEIKMVIFMQTNPESKFESCPFFLQNLLYFEQITIQKRSST